VSALRLASLATLIALASCNSRDAETGEPAIVGDSAADPAPVTVPPDSSPRAAGRSGLAIPPGPLDVNPSVPRPGRGAGMTSSATRDTLRGVVAVIGADPTPRITLRVDRQGAVMLRGAPALATLSGLEVRVAGTRTDNGFDVGEFVVRAADGVPALDGVLTDRAGQLSLVHDGATTTISGASSAIRALIGKRIWATMANGEILTFGVIEATR
jgi:hypothetical protein